MEIFYFTGSVNDVSAEVSTVSPEDLADIPSADILIVKDLPGYVHCRRGCRFDTSQSCFDKCRAQFVEEVFEKRD